MEVNITFNLMKKEKEMLQKTCRKNGMTVTDYIKYRVLYNNPEIADSPFIYEIPEKNRHNYLMMGVLQDIYQLMLQSMRQNKNETEFKEIKEICNEMARKNIISLGYLKVKADE